ncbi:MAG: hypothetical protein ABI778_06125 [Ignavibacteriota bacterium]
MRILTIIVLSVSGIILSSNAATRTIHGVFCSSGIQNQLVKDNGNPPTLAFQNDSSFEHCSEIIHEGDGFRQNKSYQAAYDKYRSFFDTCAYLNVAWEVFTSVGSMNASRSSDLHRGEEYREWLKKVLYYNLDTNYYCADLGEIQHTFGWFNDQRGDDFKGFLTFEKWVIDSSKCRRMADYLSTFVKASWDGAYERWADTVVNPTLSPFDSTLPSLDDLDLGILRGKPADVKKFFDSKYGPVFSNLIALENPFSSETKIDFTCREAVAIHFEVFDILGKKVFDGGNKIYDEGENQIVLPGALLPHGELFGRFSAADGTVKTIKLQHY